VTRTASEFPPSSQPYWDQALETQSRASWRTNTLAYLQRHLAFAYENAPFYRGYFDAADVHPRDLKALDDLQRFPFIDKKVHRQEGSARPAARKAAFRRPVRHARAAGRLHIRLQRVDRRADRFAVHRSGL
jgi:hypothetical protein